MSKQISKIASLMLAVTLCLSASTMPIRAETGNAGTEAASHEALRQTIQTVSAVTTVALIVAFIASLRWLIKVGADGRWQKTALTLTLSLGDSDCHRWRGAADCNIFLGHNWPIRNCEALLIPLDCCCSRDGIPGHALQDT